METEDSPEPQAELPARIPELQAALPAHAHDLAPTLAPVGSFDVNAPLRAPRTLKGRHITVGSRLLRLRRLGCETHESVFQSPKSTPLERATAKRAGKLRRNLPAGASISNLDDEGSQPTLTDEVCATRVATQIE